MPFAAFRTVGYHPRGKTTNVPKKKFGPTNGMVHGKTGLWWHISMEKHDTSELMSLASLRDGP
jgi:hypothetical protein